MLGLDYSGGRPSGAAIAAAGYGFVMRYLDNGLSGRANLTADEVRDLQAHNIAIGLVWERKLLVGPDRATQGAGAGGADARAALAQAAAVGLPDNPIYFCVDFDIPDYAPGNASPRAKLGPVGDYLAAARDVVGQDRMGVYGGFYAVSRALDAGLTHYAWQTRAWSGTQEDKRIHLLQRIGTVSVDRIDCDVNEQRQDDFGQHSGGSVNPDDLISPDGLTNADGSQKTDKVKNFLGYADEFARQAKDNTDTLLAKLDTVAHAVAQLAADVATLKSAAAPDFSGDYDAVLTRKPQG